MKKLFVAALAVLALTACSNDEILDAPRSAAIKFDNAFVENATRAADPSTNSNTISNFDVWAFMDETDGRVFHDENVELNNGAWTYTNTQYWTPNHKYYFAALSPMESNNVTETLANGEEAKLGLGTIAFTNVNGTEDLLYAKKMVQTNPDINVIPDAVHLQFQHLLSKVKFTFTNGFPTNNVSVAVKNIRMTAPKSATINLAQANYAKAWVLGNEAVELAFGDVENRLTFAEKTDDCADERLTIPAAAGYIYTITFDVEVYMGDRLAYSAEKKASVSDTELEMGYAYNFIAEINPDNLNMSEIEFTVAVDRWIDAADDVETVPGTPISTWAQLAELFANGGYGTLVGDIAKANANPVAATRATVADFVVPAGVKVVLDLNGNNIQGATIENNGELSLVNSTDEPSNVSSETENCVILNNGTLAVEENVYIENENEEGTAVENTESAESNIANLVDSVEKLQAAIDAAIDNYTVVLANDLAGEVTVAQKSGVNLVIDGAGYKFDGTIKVHANSNRNSGKLLVSNVNFETSTKDLNFVYAVDFGNACRYSQNITVEDCTFKAVENSEAVNTAVGVKVNATQNLVIKNCTAENMHSLLQAQSCDMAVYVDGVTVNNCKNGVSFGNTAYPTIKNSNIAATGYGIRADGDASRGNLVVETVTVEANQPIVVRKVRTAGYSISINDDTELALTENGTGKYHVAFTSGSDDADYVAPTVPFSIEGAENFIVFPYDCSVSSAEDFTAALKSKVALIKFAKDVTVSNDWHFQNAGAQISHVVTINGMGHTLKFTGAVYNPNNNNVLRFEAAAANSVVKNLTFDLSEATSTKIRAISCASAITVDNCSFIGGANGRRGIIFGEGAKNYDFEVKITNCMFANWGRGITDNENGKDVKSVVIEGNTFNNAPVYVSAYENITLVGNEMLASWANLTSYTSATTAKVKAVENELDANYAYNVVGNSNPAKNQLFKAENVECQEGFTVNVIAE